MPIEAKSDVPGCYQAHSKRSYGLAATAHRVTTIGEAWRHVEAWLARGTIRHTVTGPSQGRPSRHPTSDAYNMGPQYIGDRKAFL